MSGGDPRSILVLGATPDLPEILAPLGEVSAFTQAGELFRHGAKAGPPGLVLLASDDGLTRLEALRGLQGLWGEAAPPCLVLVEPGREDLLAEALDAGAADAVLHPVRPADLCARVSAHLRRPRAEATPQPRLLDPAHFDLPRSIPLTRDGGLLFGLYLLVAELGEGGLTRVFKGVRLSDGSLAALKVLDPAVDQQDPDWSRRFAREQKILLGIESPHLVRVRGVGTLEGLAYLDMDFVPGQPLDRVIQEAGCLPLGHAVSIGIEIALALDALHGAGIVHRDVKPENVLLDEEGRAHVCDFGLSKSQDDAGLTREGEILGTIAFIAPEILCGAKPSPEGDVYALGITLFEMLTGQDAIRPAPAEQMFTASMRGVAQREALRVVPEPVRPIVSRMLAVNPEDRYTRLSDLVKALREALAPASP